MKTATKIKTSAKNFARKYSTREEWLTAAIGKIRPLFTRAGKPVPENVRVACGFPSKNPLGAKKRRIGECWSDSASEGKIFEMFISPTIKEPVLVLATLLHEMIHATVGLACGHKGAFPQLAKALGLEGKMTATIAGEALAKHLLVLNKELGDYPHHVLDGMTNGRKKDTCRLLKAECPECGYVIRVTKKWIEEAGYPTCPCGCEFQEG